MVILIIALETVKSVTYLELPPLPGTLSPMKEPIYRITMLTLHISTISLSNTLTGPFIHCIHSIGNLTDTNILILNKFH